MNSRIEQIIEEIEEYIAGCKSQMFNDSNIIVNRDELEELLDELKNKTPEEIRRYQKIISNQEAILANAQQKADEIIAKAQVKTDELVSEHQIMQQAYARANEVVMLATKQAQEILDKATTDANNIRESAIAYTDDLLKNMEQTMSHTLETSQARQESFAKSIQGYLDIIISNRRELRPQSLLEPEAAPKREAQIRTMNTAQSPAESAPQKAAPHPQKETGRSAMKKNDHAGNLKIPEGMTEPDPEVLAKVQATMEKAFGNGNRH